MSGVLDYLGLQMLLCVAMVRSVSPSWVKTVPSKVSSFSVSLQARALARAVMDAVNSQEFKKITSAAFYALLRPGV